MAGFDEAFETIQLLARENSSTHLRNEAQTRLDLIDKVLKAFGWEFSVEDRTEEGYTDYRLGTPATVAVVEAKRESVGFTLPEDISYGKASLRALLAGSSNSSLKAALKQCMSYCADLGVSQGIVTNGHQWVAFLATRSDSVRPLEGQALLVPNLQSFCDNFTDAWNVFSEHGLKTKSLARALSAHPVPAPLPLSVRIQNYPGTKSRNDLQSSLQILGQVFLEDVPARPQLRDRFLTECYATSGALSQFSELSRAVLRSQHQEKLTDGSVAEEPVYGKRGLNEKLTGDILSAAMSNKPIVLLGDVGAGKSTFIQRLINVDAKELFSEAISIYVDYGSQATMVDLKSWTVAEVQRQIKEHYGIDIASRVFVEDIFRSELKEFDTGIFGSLKDVDLSGYTKKRVEYLAELMNDKSDHIARALDRIKRSHRKQIVVFLDNIDQRSKEDQNTVFLISNELAAQWPVTVFVTLRPETYYASMRHGAVSGYHPRVFKIMPPRPDVVIRKRLDFVLDLMAGEDQEINDILGYNLQSESLQYFLEMLSANMASNRDVNAFIDNMAGGNMRRALGFVTRFVGSGHVDTAKIVEIWARTHSYWIPEHELLRALLHGDGNYYEPESSDIANVFKCASNDIRDHFLMCKAISFVERTSRDGDSLRFVSAEEIYQALQPQGFSEASIQEALRRGVHHRLLDEPLTSRNDENFERVRVTSVGLYTKNRLPLLFSYMDAIVVDTPVLLSDYYGLIGDAYAMSQRIQRAVHFSKYLDSAWKKSGLDSEYWSWPDAQQTLRANIERVASVNRLSVSWES
ncbi:P-loop NTPase fold protein [Arthrobacter sedimenti]|uniref:P-loop NTPase fold protein n=1 Tax=Arthrobacter sedimenti TaxID=2694931 RepID=UPI00111D81D1|nr:P-loop NTPase fold protein [Arthrobacter sedimenti]